LPPTIQRIAGSWRSLSASFTSSYPASTEDRLPQHPDYSMPAVLAGSPVCKRLPGHPAEAERVVQFPMSEQPSVGGHHRTAKLEHQSAVEFEPESPVI
jgi:hypothetical protein